MNPALKRIAAKRIGDAGRRSEKRVVRALGAKPTVASGNKGHDKGDATWGDFRVEAKSTTALTLRLELQWLAKIAQEAFDKDQQPMVTVSFTAADGKSRLRGDWVMVPLSVMVELLT